jgi:hypothetical protein
MSKLHPNYHIAYNKKDQSFDFSLFNKSYLGTVLLGRVGKEKAVVNNIDFIKGKDALGIYEMWTIDYGLNNREKGVFRGIIKAYPSFLVFETINLQEMKGKKNKHPFGNPYISFPSFEGEHFEENCTCLTFKRQAPFNFPLHWKGRVIDSLREGKNTPLILANTAFETVVLSPLNCFLHGTVSINKHPESVRCGIPRSVDRIEKHNSFKIVLVVGKGINTTIDFWGEILRQEHHVRPIGHQEDRLLKYISYWTNAGSAYWYRSINQTSYEDTLKQLVAHHESIGLNFGSYQLDSWWYQKDGDQYTSSIVEWEPKEETKGKNFNCLMTVLKKTKTIEMFQEEKLSYVQRILNKPMGCHFKQLSKHSVYVNHNEEDFMLDHFALPKNKAVAKKLFKQIFNHPKWELSYVIHDWLSYMYEHHKGFRNMQLSEDYFTGIDEACLETPCEHNESGHLSLQLCMAQPHMTLNSVRMQSVTTIRSTADSNSFFLEGANRWHWHVYSSKMIQAIGKYAFYDNRRTTTHYYLPYSSYAKFEMIWLGLSCGPIGLGDPIGKENMTLIGRVIKEDGEIIKPDKPAVLLDACYLYNPYEIASKKGVTVFSCSTIPFNKQTYKVLYMLSFNMNAIGKKVTSSYTLSDTEETIEETYAVYDYFSKTIQLLHEQELKTYTMKRRKIVYHIAAPILDGFAYIGDVSKHVSASRQLVECIEQEEKRVSIYLAYCQQAHSSQWVCYSQYRPSKIFCSTEEIPFEYKDGKLSFDLKKMELKVTHVKIRIVYF